MTRGLAEFLEVEGASVAKVGGILGTETLAASDATIARIDELQFDLGEGPCWDAVATLEPVLISDIRTAQNAWPAFTRQLAGQGITTMFAFPLAIGPLRIGAMDMYASTPVILDRTTTAQAGALASIVSRHVLRDAVRSVGDRKSGGGPHSRRAIHQATGFVIAQCGVSAEDAYLLLQGQAFAEGVPMDQIAQEVVSGRLIFSATGATIGESR